MDERRAAEVLTELHARLGDRLIQWRSTSLSGSDVDLLVRPFADDEDRLEPELRAAGLEPAGRDRWRTPDRAVTIDLLHAADWPPHYPAVEGVIERSSVVVGSALPAAAPEDRLLVLAADAVAGRPLGKLAVKARGLAEEPGVVERLRERARAEGSAPLASVAEELAANTRAGDGETLAWPRAARAAGGSRHARSALAQRLGLAIERRARRLRPSPGPGLLVALSGMDGAGKSSAIETIEARLAAGGVGEVKVEWQRFGDRAGDLDPVARPLKRLLRRKASYGEPLATRGEHATQPQDPRVASGRHGPVAWTWVMVLTALLVRDYILSTLRTRDGTAILGDRWLCDTVVDLELRYSRHPAAEWLVRVGTPVPDLAILLEIDAATSAARKPGDQPLPVLDRMERLYDRAARLAQVERVDATRPREQVLRDVGDLVDRLLESRGPGVATVD